MYNCTKLNSLKKSVRRHGLHHTTKTAKIKRCYYFRSTSL